jgi:putative intracellular protease/amidase
LKFASKPAHFEVFGLRKLMMTTDRLSLRDKRAVILTADEFEDMDLFFPLFRPMEEGVDVTVAAPQRGAIHGERGYGLEATPAIADVNPETMTC